MIRKFTKKDINCVSSLIERYLGVLHDHEYNEEATIKTLDYLSDTDNNLFVILNDEDKVVGYINFHILNFPLISGKELYISELIIDEHERNNNFGTRLISFAIDKAKELDCERIMLNNSMESISYKKNFYKKLGFSQRDTMANFILKISK